MSVIHISVFLYTVFAMPNLRKLKNSYRVPNYYVRPIFASFSVILGYNENSTAEYHLINLYPMRAFCFTPRIWIVSLHVSPYIAMGDGAVERILVLVFFRQSSEQTREL